VELPHIMMDWNDLKSLLSEGHYIGSHTITHCMLGTMSNEDDVKRELLQSGNTIKDKLGYFPVTISYPVGSFNEATKRIAKQTGYTYGLAVKQRNFFPEKEDVYEISRIELYNESWLKTRLRITNTLEKLKSIIR
jgi:peptidoglycan/xylan/chitin deacetylase (PgdA/CDA1 family)